MLSILLVHTMSCFTPSVYASKACSRVCPFLEMPASNSPVLDAIMSNAQSAYREREGGREREGERERGRERGGEREREGGREMGGRERERMRSKIQW